jgi:hypothetical protein
LGLHRGFELDAGRPLYRLIEGHQELLLRRERQAARRRLVVLRLVRQACPCHDSARFEYLHVLEPG